MFKVFKKQNVNFQCKKKTAAKLVFQSKPRVGSYTGRH